MKNQKCKPGLGKNNWEIQLLDNQLRRINWHLQYLEIDPWTKRKVLQLYDKRVNKDNIVKLHTHDISLFIQHLIRDTLTELENFSSSLTPKGHI